MKNMITKTACDNCNNQVVCKYANELTAAQKALDNVTYSVDDSAVCKLSDALFIEPTILKCKYYVGCKYDGMRGI